NKFSKYNGLKHETLNFNTNKKIILIPAQVEDDASMILGGADLGVKFSALEAAKNACLAHALVAKKYKFNKNSFDAIKLIKGLK
ncbi:hypothetical protein VWM48_09775, partial [Campylobacter coli]